MRHCNWMVSDTINKLDDLIRVVRNQHKEGNLTLEEKLLTIHGLKSLNRQQVLSYWKALPSTQKTAGRLNTACS